MCCALICNTELLVHLLCDTLFLPLQLQSNVHSKLLAIMQARAKGGQQFKIPRAAFVQSHNTMQDCHRTDAAQITD